MKSVLLGIGAMVLVSCVAWGVMGNLSTSAGDRYTSQNNSVRLD